MAVDFYAELGVGRGASDDEIKRAYKRLAAELHPDRNQGRPDIEARFKRVNNAYQVLHDKKKKALYDEFGEVGLREGFDPKVARAYQHRAGPGVSFEDLFQAAQSGQAPGQGFSGQGFSGQGAGFGDLFGDLFGGARRSRKPRRIPDLESEVTIEFVSAVRGAELELSISGGRTVKVRIPQGADDGDKLRVKGAGQKDGAISSDLVLTLRVKAHPFFEREGLDLTLNLPLSIAEAYLGSKVEVPTPTGPVALKVPPRTQSGQLLRLRGKGVTRGDRTGDLYVRFLIRVPVVEGEELKKAAELLSEASSEHLRDEIQF